MRTWLLIASVLLFAIGSAPAINSSPIGFQKSKPEQSLIPVQKKKGWGKGKWAGKGKGKGKGPGCFQRCIAKGQKGAAGCSSRCK